jgi:hypothetical protein
MGFNPFALPQLLHTAIFLTSAGLLLSAFHSHSLSISKFMAERPSLSDLLSGPRTRLFTVLVNATCICILFISYRLFKYAGSRKSSSTMVILRFFLLLCTVLSLGGFLGFVSFPTYSGLEFHAVTEIIFLTATTVYVVLHELIVTLLKKRIRPLVLLHDVAVAIPIAVVLYSQGLSLAKRASPQAALFLFEYAAYIGLFSKFPIMGWQMYGRRQAPNAQKWQ